VPRKPPDAIVRVEIDGFDLPGRDCGPDLGGERCEDITVGLARGTETVEPVPGDAPSAHWAFDIDIRDLGSGELDYGGPFVLGRRGERHLGLRWTRRARDGAREVFRGAKFRLFEMDPGFVRSAIGPDLALVGRVGLTDDDGWPRCATVRPPDVTWTVEQRGSPSALR
jgi:hypothetical protein